MFEIQVCGHRAGRSVEYSMAIINQSLFVLFQIHNIVYGSVLRLSPLYI